MKMNDEKLLKQYDALMKDYEPQPFVPTNWPMENGVYKQYSAFNQDDSSIGCTSYSL